MGTVRETVGIAGETVDIVRVTVDTAGESEYSWRDSGYVDTAWRERIQLERQWI